MKLTNSDIWQAKEPLQRLMAVRFPVKTSYRLAKLTSKINESIRVIDEVRVGLIKKYGTVDERGQVAVLPDSAEWSDFVAEFNDLLTIEVDVDIEVVQLPELGDAEIEPGVLLALEKFVEV